MYTFKIATETAGPRPALSMPGLTPSASYAAAPRTSIRGLSFDRFVSVSLEGTVAVGRRRARVLNSYLCPLERPRIVVVGAHELLGCLMKLANTVVRTAFALLCCEIQNGPFRPVASRFTRNDFHTLTFQEGTRRSVPFRPSGVQGGVQSGVQSGVHRKSRKQEYLSAWSSRSSTSHVDDSVTGI